MTKINVLLDTDVILDFFFERKPFSDESADILSFCEYGKINGFLTPVIISNIYYLLRRQNKHEEVLKSLKSLLMIIDVINVDKNSIMQALASEFSDFEDALQHFSAVNHGEIDFIITRNIRDFRKSTIPIMTQKEFLGYIKTIGIE